jgi:hypothetical protein
MKSFEPVRHHVACPGVDHKLQELLTVQQPFAQFDATELMMIAFDHPELNLLDNQSGVSFPTVV